MKGARTWCARWPSADFWRSLSKRSRSRLFRRTRKRPSLQSGEPAVLLSSFAEESLPTSARTSGHNGNSRRLSIPNCSLQGDANDSWPACLQAKVRERHRSGPTLRVGVEKRDLRNPQDEVRQVRQRDLRRPRHPAVQCHQGDEEGSRHSHVTSLQVGTAALTYHKRH